MSNVKKNEVRNMSVLDLLDKVIEYDKFLRDIKKRQDEQDKLIEHIKDNVEWLLSEVYDIRDVK